MPPCPVCALEQAELRGPLVDCPRCGDFRITHEAQTNLRHDGHPWTLRVAAWIRNARLLGAREVALRAADIDWIKSTWRQHSVAEKQDALLLALAKLSEYPGALVPLVRDCDHVLAWCERVEEFDFHLGTLLDRGLVASESMDPEWALTPAGWERVATISAASPASSDLVFVAMTFDTLLDEAWTGGLQPGIASAGYRPARVDTDHHSDKIDDRIMAMIRKCRFVVVDVTTQNRGAYFEAGLALGLGRPVIWSVREDDLHNVHFDTRQFNHIVWRDTGDLRQKITDRVLGVFGQGPISP